MNVVGGAGWGRSRACKEALMLVVGYAGPETDEVKRVFRDSPSVDEIAVRLVAIGVMDQLHGAASRWVLSGARSVAARIWVDLMR